ncbi:MAG: hypothetical protein M3245_05715, partial [Actinomycetota bacterium]|nr:hypothetical protein [Actinomycetota bacterium]
TSPVGTALLLPVRLVLRGIRAVEEHVAGRPFQLGDNNAWIGLASAAMGAVLVAGALLLVRGVARAVRGRLEDRPVT